MYVSVALCTYNGAKYIEEQLQSILQQSHPVDEIIIGDDGSTDQTIYLADQLLKERNVKYKIIRNKKNLGYRKNFENVIAHTSGDIIFLSDQDDIWEKEKVKIIVNDFEQNGKCLLVFSDAVLIDANLNELPIKLWDSIYFNKNRNRFSNWADLLLSGYYVTGATMAIRRELFEKAYPFSDIWYHDGWLAMHAVVYGEIYAESTPLIKYRQHDNNQIGAEACYTWKMKLKKKQQIIKRGQEQQQKINELACRRMEELMDSVGSDMPKEMRGKVVEAKKVYGDLAKLYLMNRVKALRTVLGYGMKGAYHRYYKKPIGSMGADILFFVLGNKYIR